MNIFSAYELSEERPLGQAPTLGYFNYGPGKIKFSHGNYLLLKNFPYMVI
jgi:hypothetical protein